MTMSPATGSEVREGIVRREPGDSLHLKSGDISTASCIYKNVAWSPLGSEKKSLMATLRLLVTMKPTNLTCAVRLRIRVEAVTHIRACQVDKSCSCTSKCLPVIDSRSYQPTMTCVHGPIGNKSKGHRVTGPLYRRNIAWLSCSVSGYR